MENISVISLACTSLVSVLQVHVISCVIRFEIIALYRFAM
jgi:hypothetical protein